MASSVSSTAVADRSDGFTHAIGVVPSMGVSAVRGHSQPKAKAVPVSSARSAALSPLL